MLLHTEDSPPPGSNEQLCGRFLPRDGLGERTRPYCGRRIWLRIPLVGRARFAVFRRSATHLPPAELSAEPIAPNVFETAILKKMNTCSTFNLYVVRRMFLQMNVVFLFWLSVFKIITCTHSSIHPGEIVESDRICITPGMPMDYQAKVLASKYLQFRIHFLLVFQPCTCAPFECATIRRSFLVCRRTPKGKMRFSTNSRENVVKTREKCDHRK